ncbi:MAG: DUF2061 domain-containing protein [Patescibacteria group bacterium]
MIFNETRTRTVAKTVSWRILATLLTWATVYWFTGLVRESLKITLTAAVLSMIVYYIFERLWNMASWGRTLK